MVLINNVKRSASVLSNRLSIALIAAVCVASPSWAELPATQSYGGVEYVTGGFGIDESTAIKSAMSDYPLVFTFSASDGNRGAYVSRVQVVMRNQYDATVLNVETQGPFLLARIEPGDYQVHVTYRNQTQTRQISVTDGNSTRLVFEWKRDAVDPVDQKPAAESDAEKSDERPESAPDRIPGVN